MSPIGQGHTPAGAFYPLQTNVEDQRNVDGGSNICRANQKPSEGNDQLGGDNNANQQGSILEKALVKQEQEIFNAQGVSATTNASAEWPPPLTAGGHHMNNPIVGGNGYNAGATDIREIMAKHEIDPPTVGDYIQHHHHLGHHQHGSGQNHNSLSNQHNQIYANNATLHIPGEAEDHHVIRHTPVVVSAADQYHSNVNHHHPPPWVR